LTNANLRSSVKGLWTAGLVLAAGLVSATPVFLPDSTPRHFGGPDSGGYCWIDSDTVGGPQYNWIDTTGFQYAPNLGDEYRINIPVYFSYPYYDSSYAYVYVSANGWLAAGHVDPGGTGDSTSGHLPSTTAPNNMICPFWDNLAMGPGFGGGYLRFRTFGAAPDRYFVLIFHNVNRIGTETTNLLTFEVIIHEDGDIVFQYADVTVGDSLRDHGRSASVGIENRTGTTGLQYMRGHPDSSVNWPGNRLLSGRAVKFWKRGPGIAEQPGRTAEHMSLAPEPAVAHRSCRVRYTLPANVRATLAVYDALGRTVLTRPVQGSGWQQVVPGGPGVYHCVLSSAHGRLSAKLIAVD